MSAPSVPPPIGVLLFSLGGPGTLADVEPFLVRLFSDREIIQLPLGALVQPLFARLIAKRRGPSVRRNYASIGGGSPQLRLTLEQAAALEARLNRGQVWNCCNSRGLTPRVRVGVAMRYWYPDTESALEAMAEAGASRLVTLTLYPHYSRATTGSSKAELERVLDLPRWRGRFRVTGIDAYPDEPLYVDALADTVRRGLDTFAADRRDHVVVLFSAHGLPQRLIDAGDPYVTHTTRTVDCVLGRLRVPNRTALAYQSRTGPVKWIGPGTEAVLRDLGREGVREVLVVPVSFVSDHIETLYEVDQLFRDEAREAGIVKYRRSEALNSHPVFIEALAGLVERHVGEHP